MSWSDIWKKKNQCVGFYASVIFNKRITSTSEMIWTEKQSFNSLKHTETICFHMSYDRKNTIFLLNSQCCAKTIFCILVIWHCCLVTKKNQKLIFCKNVHDMAYIFLLGNQYGAVIWTFFLLFIEKETLDLFYV